jgi:hypothetical protein
MVLAFKAALSKSENTKIMRLGLIEIASIRHYVFRSGITARKFHPVNQAIRLNAVQSDQQATIDENVSENTGRGSQSRGCRYDRR